MVVLQVNKFFYERGGAERYCFTVSAELEARGHKVVAFAMDHPRNKPSAYRGYFVSRRDYHYPAGMVRALRTAREFVRSREAAVQMRRLLREERVDLAHLHNIYHQITPSIIPVLKEAGIPLVMTLHDYKLICPCYTLFTRGSYCFRCRQGSYWHAIANRCADGSWGQSLLLAAEAYWQKLTKVYNLIDLFLAPSTFIRDRFLEAGFPAGKIIYLPSFAPAARGNPGEEGDLPERFVLYFGRLSPEKGLRTLLEAVGILGDAELVLCGEGPMEGEIRERVDSKGLSKVRLLGYVDKTRLEAIVARAAVVVLPSLCPDNAPLAALEAAVQGKAMVLAAVGGLVEMAQRLGARLFQPGRADELASHLRSLWEDPEEAEKMGERARRVAAEYYSLPRHMDRLEEVYRDLTRRASLSPPQGASPR